MSFDKIYTRFGWMVVVILLSIWIIRTPSPFQKGGVETAFYYRIALFVGINSLLINLMFTGVRTAELVLVAIPFTFASLFITTLLILPAVIEALYKDRTWFFWEEKHRLFINTVYYGLNTIILAIAAKLYLQIRRRS